MILSKLQHRLQNQQQTKRLERCGLYEKYKKQAAKQLNGGFTLVELLVVIAIMAVIIHKRIHQGLFLPRSFRSSFSDPFSSFMGCTLSFVHRKVNKNIPLAIIAMSL